jgi:DNA-binding transcriptional MerR regulator
MTTTRTEPTQLVTEVSGHEVVAPGTAVGLTQARSGTRRKSEAAPAAFDLGESLRQIPDRMYFRIGSVAELLDVKPYVLRYWESEFPMISPQKSSSGQRVYRRTDVETVILIKHLLYHERYSIEGARKKIRELRKDGELKSLKSESRQGVEKSRRLRIVAQELRALVQTPLRDIFKY